MAESNSPRRCSSLQTKGCLLAVLLSVASAVWAQSAERVLYTFQGAQDGGNPYAGVILDFAGNLYGIATYGGGGNCADSNGTGCGTVFKLSASQGTWKHRTLYKFQGGTDGDRPRAPLLRDRAGNLFGTTASGGVQSCTNGCGTVFELTPNGDGRWSEQVIYALGAITGDGHNPQAPLTFDKQGNLYGTAYDGGSGGLNAGTVFELSPDGSGGWTERTLYAFPYYGAGGFPAGGVTFDRAGNLYGTALGGGGACARDYCGTVWELMPSNGTWSEVTLYQFKGNPDGLFPYAGVVLDGQGNVYGTTPTGGPYCQAEGCGTVYEMSSSGGQWSEKLIHSFSGSDGFFPDFGNLVFDQAGNLYGTTESGGLYNHGTVFKLTPTQSGWQETVLYSFHGGTDGGAPFGGVVLDVQGDLYGTTESGGAGSCRGGCGVVFEIVP